MNDFSQDTQKVLASIINFPRQCRQALQETVGLDLKPLAGIENIVVSGMGGSSFAADIVKNAFKDALKVPLEIINDYSLPAYAGPKTLVIASSYSGGTEEVLSCAAEALAKKAPVLALTTGGLLKEMVDKKQISGYVFNDSFNPSGQPRMATGYMLCGLVGILAKLQLLTIDLEKMNQALDWLEKQEIGPARELAGKLKDKFAILVTSGFLQGAIHGFANQLNETAKANSSFHFIPEMDHHRLEGLVNPSNFPQLGLFVFYNSPLFSEAIKLRFELTKEVVYKNKFQYEEFTASGPDKLSQLLQVIQFNLYVSFYLSQIYQVNPIKIPWVDYFKQELKKRQTAHGKI